MINCNVICERLRHICTPFCSQRDVWLLFDAKRAVSLPTNKFHVRSTNGVVWRILIIHSSVRWQANGVFGFIYTQATSAKRTLSWRRVACLMFHKVENRLILISYSYCCHYYYYYYYLYLYCVVLHSSAGGETQWFSVVCFITAADAEIVGVIYHIWGLD